MRFPKVGDSRSILIFNAIRRPIYITASPSSLISTVTGTWMMVVPLSCGAWIHLPVARASSRPLAGRSSCNRRNEQRTGARPDLWQDDHHGTVATSSAWPPGPDPPWSAAPRAHRLLLHQ